MAILYATLADALAPKKLGTMIYYGNEPALAVKLAHEMRARKEIAQTRDARMFDGVVEHCKSVIVMPDVLPRYRERIVAAYGDKVQASTSLEAGPAPTPATREESVPVPRRRGRPPKAEPLSSFTPEI